MCVCVCVCVCVQLYCGRPEFSRLGQFSDSLSEFSLVVNQFRSIGPRVRVATIDPANTCPRILGRTPRSRSGLRCTGSMYEYINFIIQTLMTKLVLGNPTVSCSLSQYLSAVANMFSRRYEQRSYIWKHISLACPIAAGSISKFFLIAKFSSMTQLK